MRQSILLIRKHDTAGARLLIAEVKRGSVRLFSRNRIDVTARYPAIAQALRSIIEPYVIDGELVALDAKGRSHFQLLQNALRDERTRLQYCVFDLLFLGMGDVRRRSLLERKRLLKEMLPRTDLLRYGEHIQEEGMPHSGTVPPNDQPVSVMLDFMNPVGAGGWF
jgi:bifunctional non-homologous end joining protein LigD